MSQNESDTGTDKSETGTDNDETPTKAKIEDKKKVWPHLTLFDLTWPYFLATLSTVEVFGKMLVWRSMYLLSWHSWQTK